ncbi:GNAT family N-acetyltransferase [Chloroflexi bacterium TSY]|nr:GNAT family N-acetyltransferase [Chloroflexi bacterium TSY]
MSANQNNNYTIEHYSHDHDEGLAVMWNESDDQWPGTLTNGVPMTAERWGDWMDKEVSLMRLVVVQDNGPIVGFGSLWDSTDRKGESCYVDLLNVHPEHQGRSLCRRMLTQIIDYATDQGYVHVTLGTWTSNLKAVPLYKKTGFYWRPDTSVYMENYIPALRKMPVLVDFFQRSDWYQDYDRALELIEDNERHPKTGDMKIYIYRWKNHAGETIEAIIDRQSQQLCGLETPDFAVYARVDETKPAMGLTYDIIWSITNKQAHPLSIDLDIAGDEGIHVATDSSIALNLGANETKERRSTYCCSPNAPKIDLSRWQAKPMPAVRAKLKIAETELTLGVGLLYQKPVELSCHPDVVSGLLGQSQTVLVQVQNRLAERIQGQLDLQMDASTETNVAAKPDSVDPNFRF